MTVNRRCVLYLTPLPSTADGNCGNCFFFLPVFVCMRVYISFTFLSFFQPKCAGASVCYRTPDTDTFRCCPSTNTATISGVHPTKVRTVPICGKHHQHHHQGAWSSPTQSWSNCRRIDVHRPNTMRVLSVENITNGRWKPLLAGFCVWRRSYFPVAFFSFSLSNVLC